MGVSDSKPTDSDDSDITDELESIRAQHALSVSNTINSANRAKIKCLIFPGNFHRTKKFKGALKKINFLNKNIFNLF